MNPINAMVNYGLAVRLTGVLTKAIADGYDPMLCVLRDRRHSAQRLAIVLCPEPHGALHPVVDPAVLRLMAEEKVTGADLFLQRDGVCRPNPERG